LNGLSANFYRHDRYLIGTKQFFRYHGISFGNFYLSAINKFREIRPYRAVQLIQFVQPKRLFCF